MIRHAGCYLKECLVWFTASSSLSSGHTLAFCSPPTCEFPHIIFSFFSKQLCVMILPKCLQRHCGNYHADPHTQYIFWVLWHSSGMWTKFFYVTMNPTWASFLWVSLSLLLQCVSTGICVGAALQKIVALANLICYYVFSLPVGAALMFATDLGLMGKVSSSFFLINKPTRTNGFSITLWKLWRTEVVCGFKSIRWKQRTPAVHHTWHPIIFFVAESALPPAKVDLCCPVRVCM